MKLGDAGRSLIQSFESCRLKAYRDGGGVWTVGWGHTGPEVREGLTISQERADWLFEQDIAQFERDVNSLVKVSLTQNQFDALVSFAYNCGSDIDADTIAEGLGDSALLRKLNAGDYAGAAAEFPRWNKDNGKVVAGLTRRREAEKALFLTANSAVRRAHGLPAKPQ